MDYPPFCIVHEDGQADGFSVELMRAALAAMGRDVTFRTGPWAEVRGWLERGEVGALPLVGRTPEREPLFDFTVPYMTMHGAIVVRGDADGVHSLADLGGRRVGTLKSDNAEEFLRREPRGFEIVTFPTFSDAFRALAAGQCDAVVAQRLVALRVLAQTGLRTLRIVQRPVEGFSQDFCFAVKEGDRDTLALLNEGLALVIADGTHRRLHSKWFAALELPSDRPIVIGGDHNYPPYEFLDEKGRPTGYNVELVRAVAQAVGMDIEVRLGPWRDIVRDLERGEIDAVEGMFCSEGRDRQFDFSQAHTVNQCVSVVRRGTVAPPSGAAELAGLSIVVQSGDIMHAFVQEHGLTNRLTTVDAQEDALRAVADGTADCALVARMTALYWIEKLRLDDLVVGRKALLTGEYGFAVPNGSRALLAQLSEGLNVVEQSGEYRRIYEKWMGVYPEPSTSLLQVLKHLAVVTVPLLVALGLVFLWSWTLRRKVAERTLALRISEERYEKAQAMGHTGNWEYDPLTEHFWGSQEAKRIYGFDPASNDFRANEVEGCIPERERVHQALVDLLEKDAPYDLELDILTHDQGVRKTIHSIAEVTRNARGEPVKVVGVIRDITRQKEAERAIEAQYNLLRVAGETVRFGGWSVDVATGQVTWSDVVAEIHGMEPGYSPVVEEGIGFYAPEWRERITEVFTRCATEGVPYDEEMEILTHAGERVWARTVGRAVRDEQGHVVRVDGSFQDISDLKRREAQILHLMNVLRAVRDVNQLITHEKDASALLRRACAVLTSTRGYRSAWIALRNPAGELAVAAESGIGEDFSAVTDMLARGAWPECCQLAMAPDAGIVVMRNTDTNCKACPLSHAYRDAAALAGALRHDGREYGVLVVALPAGMAEDDQEQSLFQELVGDIAYALRSLDLEAERRESEQSLAEANLRYRETVRGGGVGLWDWDLATNKVRYSPEWKAQIGYADDEIADDLEEWRSRVHPDDLPATLEAVKRSIDACSDDYRSEFRFRHKDGSWRWIAARGSVLTDTMGKAARVVGSHVDITERKTAETRLRVAEERFRRSIAWAPFPAMIHAEDGEVLLVNSIWTFLTGYAAEEIPTIEAWTERAYGDRRHTVLAEIDSLYARTGRAEEGEFTIRCRDGSTRVWAFASTPLGAVGEGDDRRLVLSMAMDVTERDRLQEQLTQSQKLESIGRLAGGVAHDFNNLLMGIMNYVELCRDGIGADHPVRAWLDEIANDAQRSAGLVRQLLAFARKQTIAPKVLDLNDAVAGTLKMLRRLIGEDIDLVWKPGAGVRSVRMDPGQLDQILANLCVNARDAIDGVGKVTIETAGVTIDAEYCADHAEARPGEFVMLAISDDGCGMDAETVARIFEPFFTTKGVGEGTGLGLATVYGIVKQNDGFVNVYSEPGAGATFRIYLPACSAEVTAATPAPAAAPRPGGTETILLVEDEKSVRVTTAMFLTDLGYTVLAAESPEKALARAAGHAGEIDLLITDVVMPGMSGRDLAAALASTHPGMRCIYISGYTANVIAHRGILDDGVAFLPKPFSRDDLARKVREVLETSS